MEVSSLHSIGGAGVRTCVHCYRLGAEPHMEWCPDRGKEDETKAKGNKPGGSGGGGPGDPNIAPPPIDPGGGGTIVDAEFTVVNPMSEEQHRISEQKQIEGLRVAALWGSPSAQEALKALEEKVHDNRPALGHQQPAAVEHRETPKRRLPGPHRG